MNVMAGCLTAGHKLKPWFLLHGRRFAGEHRGHSELSNVRSLKRISVFF